MCGHPDKESLNYALAQAYISEAKKNNEVKFIHLRDLVFNYNLEYGYNKRTELEPDLLQAQEDILWADHLVWVFPTWWGSYPAVMKAFIDRVFLPGFAFKYHKDSPWWDKLLQNKTARIITSMHTPYWYYRLMFGAPSIKQLKKVTLEFCGVKKVETTVFSVSQNKKHDIPKDKWFQKVRELGKSGR